MKYKFPEALQKSMKVEISSLIKCIKLILTQYIENKLTLVDVMSFGVLLEAFLWNKYKDPSTLLFPAYIMKLSKFSRSLEVIDYLCGNGEENQYISIHTAVELINYLDASVKNEKKYRKIIKKKILGACLTSCVCAEGKLQKRW